MLNAMFSKRFCLIFTYFAVLALMLVGTTRVFFSQDPAAAMLEESGPEHIIYQEYLEHFPSDVGVVVVFVGLLCDAEGWNLIRNVEAAYSENRVIAKVSSVVSRSARYVTGDQDSIDLQIFRDTNFSPSERCFKAVNYTPFQKILVSDDALATAMYLTSADEVGTEAFTHTVTKIRDSFRERAKSLGGDILITGDPIMSSEIANVLSRDIRYIALMILLLLAVTYFVTNSGKTCLASMLTMSLSLIGAFGFMGWIGLGITPGTALGIFLLGPLSAAFVIHAHGYKSRSEEDCIVPKEAVVPTLFAGGTTALLFACTALTKAPDVRSLALLGVVGIFFATLAIFLITYPLLGKASELGYALKIKLPRLLTVRPFIGYSLLLLLLVETTVGLYKLRFEYEAVDYLTPTNPKRAEFEEIGTWFGRMNIPIIVTSPTSVEDPDIWISLLSFEKKLSKSFPNIHVSSFHRQLSEVTRVLTADNSGEQLTFPENREQLSQILLLFDQSDYDSYISDDRKHLTVALQVPFIGSAEYKRLENLVESHFSNTQFQASLTGRVSGFFDTGHQVGIDNLKGLALGGLIVFVLFLFLFKSVSLAFVGLIINAIPVLSALGALGIADVPIDLGSSIVTAIAFGIIVDDSSHLLLRIKRLTSEGVDLTRATDQAIRDFTAPIVVTTLMITLGFSTLYAAELQSFHDFANTILIAMGAALMVDLLILPALIRTLLKYPHIYSVSVSP